MKRVLLVAGVGLAICLVAVVIGVAIFLDSAVKRGVETVGPRVTKVDVKLDAVALSILGGSGKVKGFELGNPEGYKTPHAIRVGTASLEIQPGSLLSDKVIIDKINVEAPEITFETDLRANNLSKILSNIEESMGGASDTNAAAEPESTRKFQVNEFVVTGGKINLTLSSLGGQSATVPLPEIRLKDLGTGPDGITAAALAKQVLQAVLSRSVQSASAAASELATSAVSGVADEAGKSAKDAIDKVGGQLGGFLRKKKEGPPPGPPPPP